MSLQINIQSHAFATMNRNQIKDAAKAFSANHQSYITDWCSEWIKGINVATMSGIPVPIKDLGDIIPDWDAMEPESIVWVFHWFWNALPPTMSIRTYGFSEVCDIAENIFGFDEEDDSLALAN